MKLKDKYKTELCIMKISREFQAGRGVVTMCKIMEDVRNEKAKEITIRMIKAGKMSLEDIADYTELSLDAIKELEIQSIHLS